MTNKYHIKTIFKAIDRITAPVGKMQSRVGRFTRSTERNINNIANVSRKMASVVKAATVGVVASFASVGYALSNVVRHGAEFEQTMVRATAKFGIEKGTKAFSALNNAAKQVGSTTEFTASQAAGALDFMAMAGFKAKTAIEILPDVVNFATASNLEFSRASDIVTDTLGAFGLASKDPIEKATQMRRVMDVMSKAANSSNVTVEQMFETLKKAGPSAIKAGSDLETVASQVQIMADAGIKAEIAGTAISNSYLNLSAPVGRAAKLLKQYNIQVLDTNKNLKPMGDVIAEINKKTKHLSKTQQLAVLSHILGREGLAGNLNVMSKGKKTIDAYAQALRNAGGYSGILSSKIRDTFMGSWKSLQSAISGVKIEIFELEKGPLRDIVDQMTVWINTNRTFIAQNIANFIRGIADQIKYLFENKDQIISYVTSLVDFGKKMLGLIIVFKAFGAILTTVNALMLMNPIGVFIVAVTSLVAVVYTLWNHWEGVVKTIKTGYSFMKNLFGFSGKSVDIDAKIKDKIHPSLRSPAEGNNNKAHNPFAKPQVQKQNQTIMNKSEVTLKIPEKAEAQVTKGTLSNGLILQATGI